MVVNVIGIFNGDGCQGPPNLFFFLRGCHNQGNTYLWAPGLAHGYIHTGSGTGVTDMNTCGVVWSQVLESEHVCHNYVSRVWCVDTTVKAMIPVSVVQEFMDHLWVLGLEYRHTWSNSNSGVRSAGKPEVAMSGV